MQLAFGLIGAAVGSTGVFAGVGGLLGMTSMGFGWQLGSMIGGLMGAGGQDTTQDGPRLADLKVQNSAYGVGIPIIYGTMRVAGNIIDSTDKIEHKTSHTQSSGGKGGGGSTTTYNEYTYTISFQLALCEGPISGVKRIWINSKLAYDAGSTSVTDIASSTINASNLTIYLGTETQNPDPTFEAIRGVGNVPAYRGTAYISVANMQLAEYSNSIPNIEVEVVCNGTQTPGVRQVSSQYLTATKDITSNNRGAYFSDADVGVAYLKTYAYQSDFGDAAAGFGQTILGFTNDGQPAQEISMESIAQSSMTDQWFTHGTPITVGSTSLTPRYVGSMLTGKELSPFSHIWTFVDQGATRVLGGSYKIIFAEQFANSINYSPTSSWNVDDVLIDAGERGRFVKGCVLSTSRDAMFVLTASSYNSAPDRFFKVMASSGDFYVAQQGTVSDMTTSDDRYGFGWANIITTDGYSIWEQAYENLFYKLKKYKIVANKIVLDHTYDIGNTSYSGMFVKGGICSCVTGYTYPFSAQTLRIDNYTDTPTMTVGSVSLGSVVSDLCARSGLNITDYDTSMLTQQVDGLAISRPTNARGILNILQQSYFFDAVESDNSLKFVNRGQSPVAEFIEDDLAAYDATSSNSQVPDQIKMTRVQEMELPYEVNVTYLSKDQNYQEGTQYDRRLNTKAVNVLSTQLPLAMSDSKARSIASVGLYNAWQERMTFSFSTSRKYAHIDPTDVVYVSKNGQKLAARITKRTDRSDGTIEWEAVHEDIAVYSQSFAAGTSSNVGSQTIDYAYPLVAVPFESVALRDSDASEPCYYLAVSSSNQSGGSGMAYESTDSGTTWNLKTQVSGQCGIGVLTSDLPLPNTFSDVDWSLVATVKIQPWVTLSSCSYDDIINQKNTILIGNEVVQFMTANSLGSGVWQLSGLMRGLRGTDVYASHLANERVIILDSQNLRKISYPSSEISNNRLVTAVAWGGSTSTTRKTSITPTSKNTKCLAPCSLNACRNDVNGDWTINWVRRTRKGGAWANSQDALLDEATESYKVRIYLDSSYSTLKATYTVSTNSLSYTLAMQNADVGGGALGGIKNLYVTVCQVGASGDGEVAYGSFSRRFQVAVNDVYLASSLLHMTGTDGATTFADEYPGRTWTATNVSQTISKSYYPGKTSAVFNGTNSSLDLANHSSMTFAGANGFSIEVFFRPNMSGGTEMMLIDTRRNTSVVSPCLSLLPSGKIRFYKDSSTYIDSTLTVADLTWSHVALARTGPAGAYTTLYVNGLADFSVVDNITYDTLPAIRLGLNRDGSKPFNGNMNGFQFSCPTARYSSDFIVDTAPFGKYLLGLHMDSGFTDAIGRSVNNTGGTISSTNYVFGGASGSFASGQYLTAAQIADMNLGTQDWCCEFRCFFSAAASPRYIVDTRPQSTASTNNMYLVLVGQEPTMYVNNSVVAQASTNPIIINQWNHVAFVCYNSKLYMYVNGVLSSGGASIPSITATSAMTMFTSGYDAKTTYPWGGLVDDFRFVIGRPVYTAAFTPPTSAFK